MFVERGEPLSGKERSKVLDLLLREPSSWAQPCQKGCPCLCVSFQLSLGPRTAAGGRRRKPRLGTRDHIIFAPH